jgi:hypothetical protein
MDEPIDDSLYPEEPQDPRARWESEPDVDEEPVIQQKYIYVKEPEKPKPEEPKSFLASLSTNMWILIFVAFMLGFFMGKTMQPVIIRG